MKNELSMLAPHVPAGIWRRAERYDVGIDSSNNPFITIVPGSGMFQYRPIERFPEILNDYLDLCHQQAILDASPNNDNLKDVALDYFKSIGRFYLKYGHLGLYEYYEGGRGKYKDETIVYLENRPQFPLPSIFSKQIYSSDEYSKFFYPEIDGNKPYGEPLWVVVHENRIRNGLFKHWEHFFKANTNPFGNPANAGFIPQKVYDTPPFFHVEDRKEQWIDRLIFTVGPIIGSPIYNIAEEIWQINWTCKSLLDQITLLFLQSIVDRYLLKTCKKCGNRFVSKNNAKEYCSPSHSGGARVLRTYERRAKALKLHKTGRYSIHQIGRKIGSDASIVKNWITDSEKINRSKQLKKEK